MHEPARRWLGDFCAALEDGRFRADVDRIHACLDGLPATTDREALVARGRAIGAAIPVVWEHSAAARSLVHTGLRLPFVQATDAEAQALSTRLYVAYRAWRRALASLPAGERAAVLDDDAVAPLRPAIDFELESLEPEDDRHRLTASGPRLWESIAMAIEANFSAEVEGRNVGAAEADGIVRAHPDEAVRRTLSEARSTHNAHWKELWAKAVDARAVWFALQSPEAAVGRAFVDNRMEAATWGAIDGVLRARGRGLAQAAEALRSEVGHLDASLSWNALVPLPSGNASVALPMDEALDAIRRAFSVVGDDLVETVDAARSKGWIEGEARPFKRSGAWMTPFVRAMEPRIAITWGGTDLDALILAHELGHAHHLLCMRGLPWGRTVFPSAMAEVMSVFAEHLYRQESAPGPARRYVESQFDRYLWAVPVQVRFESRVLLERAGRPWTPDRLDELWLEVHEGAPCDPNGWCRPLLLGPQPLARIGHVVGALVSQLLVETMERDRAGFSRRLNGFLRDTGTLRFEQLLERHLEVDAHSPATWERALRPFQSVVDS